MSSEPGAKRRLQDVEQVAPPPTSAADDDVDAKRATKTTTVTTPPRPAEARGRPAPHASSRRSEHGGRVLLVPVDGLRLETTQLLQWVGREPETRGA